MRVLVCGGRNYDDWRRLFAELDRIHAETPITVVIHGACVQKGMISGADRWAQQWALAHEVPYWGWPAKFRTGPDGPKEGPKRNRLMVERSKPQIVIGFPTPGERNKGTNGMLRLAREARDAGADIKVIEITPS